LLVVDYVDGNGELRRAAEDAADVVDREALWAFRGGGGVGVATALTVELVAPQELWAGYQLWSIDALGPVVDAWASAMGQIGDAFSTSISVLHTPPGAPAFPPALRGGPVVHLAFASPQGADAASPLLRALRTAPAPVVDSSWAPADAARLAEIHLDPSNPVPALGIGRWLGPRALDVAADVLDTAAAVDSPSRWPSCGTWEMTRIPAMGRQPRCPAPSCCTQWVPQRTLPPVRAARMVCPTCVPPPCPPTSGAPLHRLPTAGPRSSTGWTTQDCSDLPASALPLTPTSDSPGRDCWPG
ncbi:MAG TPA: hypothetical protein VFQ42_14415, partial [Mycobacterium sp.]|nr:hypothetical protein [Mycobacterium sp.]